jgi:uncharacterized protein (DUF1499 family)
MRLLTLSKRLALLGVVLLLAGPLGTRLGLFSFVVGFACFAMSAMCGLLALVLSVVGGLRTGQWKRAGVVLAAALSLLAVPAAQIVGALGAPPIHDLTTDTADPPAFVAALPLRAAANAVNPPEYAGAEVAAQQHRAFPDLQPLVMTMLPHMAFDRVLAEVRTLGWKISAAEPAEGRIEAVDTTMFFGFKDDVVIRLRAVEGGTRVDVRSKSRVGLGDTGTNATRIRRLLGALRAAR